MRKQTKNRGLRAASVFVALFLSAVFLSGNVFGGILSNESQSSFVIKDFKTPFVGVDFFVADRPVTASVSIKYSAELLPGFIPEVTARCNSPGNGRLN